MRLKRACNAKHAAACQKLGYAAYHGLGGKLDRNRSVKLIAKACRLGRAESCNESGLFLVEGKGKNLKKASRFFEDGCKLEYGESCKNVVVAEIQLNGEKFNRKRAKRFAARGCELGNKAACGFAQRLGSEEKQAKKAGEEKQTKKAGEETAKTTKATPTKTGAKERAANMKCYQECLTKPDPNLSMRELRTQCATSCGF